MMMDKVGRKKVLHSMKWLFFWVALAIVFNIGVYFFKGEQAAIDFLGGYLTEMSLSIDNVFVFLMIFMSFRVGEYAQHRVLGWGILGAIVLRFVFVVFGVAAVNKFEWVLYVFGALLVFSAVKMVIPEKEEKDPQDRPIIKLLQKIFPMTETFVENKFFVKMNGKKMMTPLFAVLVLIETSDIIFAIDSVPAVISITRDMFIVYTSNIFAILGLRQLFFVIEHVQSRFQYVKYGVAIILAFTGVKMLLGFFDIHIATHISIAVIVGVLFVSIMVSWLWDKHKELINKDDLSE